MLLAWQPAKQLTFRRTTCTKHSTDFFSDQSLLSSSIQNLQEQSSTLKHIGWARLSPLYWEEKCLKKQGGKARQNWNRMINSAEVRTAFAEKTMSQAEAPLPQLGPVKAGSARDRALRGQEGRSCGHFPPVPAIMRYLGKTMFLFHFWFIHL